jgi:hypothetical protein
MKSQVQLELMQLVKGSTKGKSKLASMIKRIQDHGDDSIVDNKLETDNESVKNSEHCSKAPPPAPPLPPNRQSTDSISLKSFTQELNSSFHNISSVIEKSSLVNEKFNSLICPQPFHSPKPRAIKKTFSLQQQQQQTNVCKNKSGKESTSNSCFNGLKHSMSFNTKNESSSSKGNVSLLNKNYTFL